jgi:hypothetical protein
MNNKNINIIILVVCFNFFGCAFKAKQSAPPESLYEIKQPLLVVERQLLSDSLMAL